MQTIIEEINPIIRGWFHYFNYCRKWQLEAVDRWIRGRLRRSTAVARNERGRGLDHHGVANSYFEELGLFSLVAAHESFSESKEEIPRWQIPDLFDGNP